MKKWLGLMIALVLVLLSAAAAFGETAGAPDLYDMYEVADDGKVWIGTAVPIMDGVVITSPASLPETMTDPVIWDGSAYRHLSVALSTAEGAVLVLLHETDGEQPAISAYPLLESGRVIQAEEITVRSGDWLKSRINRAVYDLSVISWKNRDALLLTLSGDTAVGSPLITRDGKLAGMIVAEYAEGINRYVALPVTELVNCIQEASDLLYEPEEDSRPEGYKVTMDRNLVTFDWSEVELPETKEGEQLYFIVADSESGYLTYFEVGPDETQATMLLTPGRMYQSGLDTASGMPEDLPAQLAVTWVPEAEPLTEHEFRSKVFAIAELAHDRTALYNMPTVVDQVTEKLLRSDFACIYSVSTYHVDKALEDCTLLITLTDPEGNNYRYESAWYYDPSVMEKDEWYVRLAETGLLDMLNDYGYPEGIYEMAMYIDGQLADSFSFELTK